MPLDLATVRSATVMGLGRFGGGAGVTRWLAAAGVERLLVTDLDRAERLSGSLATIRDLVDEGRITLRLGEHRAEDFTGADLIVANPAAAKPWSNPYLGAAREAGVPVTTEIRLLVEHLPRRDRVIGVTGSAGKSTTAAMIHHVLQSLGRSAHFGGNVGGSLLCESILDEDWVVLELSSAMLYWLDAGAGYDDAPAWAPGIGVITNLAPNHLDWHGSFEHYIASKLNMARHQTEGDTLIVGEGVREAARRTGDDLPARAIEAGDGSIDFPLRIPGAHNQRNARLATAAVNAAIGASEDEIVNALKSFDGLPHRLQLVIELEDGTRFYNDSKSTTPEATVLAIGSFDDPSRVHLIAGGYDKGIDLSPIAALAPRLAGLCTIGAVGEHLAGIDESDRSIYVETLDLAVERTFGRLRPGDVVLLSPGCASWDQFTNFEVRGERFIELVSERIKSWRM